MRQSRIFLSLTAALLLCVSCARASEVTAKDLLDDMLSAFAVPSARATERIDRDTEALQDPVLTAAAESWKTYYLNRDPKILYMKRNDPGELEVPDPAKHAFVVLGFCLKDGMMEPELQGRCDAAAAAAQAYPGSTVICTGGETGYNNSAHNTEAGLMAVYLIDKCGIEQERLWLDTEASTTAENALNAFEIMKENGIETMTLVTSGYHLRWAALLFDTVAAWYREQGTEVRITGNWCYYVSPASGYTNTNESLAISQLRSLLLQLENPEDPAAAADAQ